MPSGESMGASPVIAATSARPGNAIRFRLALLTFLVPAKRPAKAATKKATAKKGPSKTAKPTPARKPAPAKTAPPAAALRRGLSSVATEDATPAPAKKAAVRRPTDAPPVQKTRVVVPLEIYEGHKDAIKAPFKSHAMKWNFLGEGKGLYKRPDGGIHCFVHFKDDGVHYSIWGDDRPGVQGVLATWRKILGETAWAQATTTGDQAVAAEKQEQVSEAMKLWKLAEPQRRPGEPDFFFDKRLAEWQAKKPA